MAKSAKEMQKIREDAKQHRMLIERITKEEKESVARGEKMKNEMAGITAPIIANPNFQPKGKLKQSWVEEIKTKREQIQKAQEEKKEAPALTEKEMLENEQKQKETEKDNLPQKQEEPKQPQPKSIFIEEPGTTSPKLFMASEPEPAPAKAEPPPDRKEQRSAQLEMDIRLMQKQIDDVKERIDTQKSSEGLSGANIIHTILPDAENTYTTTKHSKTLEFRPNTVAPSERYGDLQLFNVDEADDGSTPYITKDGSENGQLYWARTQTNSSYGTGLEFKDGDLRLDNWDWPDWVATAEYVVMRDGERLTFFDKTQMKAWLGIS